MKDWFDVAKKVNYGPDDSPDKYGFTEKMHDIWDLVEAEKPLDRDELIKDAWSSRFSVLIEQFK